MANEIKQDDSDNQLRLQALQDIKALAEKCFDPGTRSFVVDLEEQRKSGDEIIRLNQEIVHDKKLPDILGDIHHAPIVRLENVVRWADDCIAKEISAQKESLIETLMESANTWQELVDRHQGVLLGQRLIVHDKYERTYSQFTEDGKPHYKLELPRPGLIGVSIMNADGAATVKAHLEATAPDIAPFTIVDFQEFARKNAAQVRSTVRALGGNLPDESAWRLNSDERKFVGMLRGECGMAEIPALQLNKQLGELAAKHFKLCHIDSEQGLSAAQSAARDQIEEQVNALVADVPGIRGGSFMYDPSGSTAGVKFKSGNNNSLGNGGMWKIPLDDKTVSALNLEAPGAFWEQHAQASLEGDELAIRLQEAGANDAKAMAESLRDLTAAVAKLSYIQEENGELTDDQDDAKWAIRDRIRELVGDVKGVTDIEFSNDPRFSTVILMLENGRNNRMSGGWAVEEDVERMDALDEAFWEAYLDPAADEAKMLEKEDRKSAEYREMRAEYAKDVPLASVPGATMRLNLESGMAEVVINEQVTSFGGVPAISDWVAENGVSKSDANRLYVLDAEGSHLPDLSEEAYEALAGLEVHGSPGQRPEFCVLTIEETGHAAFGDSGMNSRNNECARIITEAADRLKMLDNVDGVDFKLYDVNGNPVGSLRTTDEPPVGEPGNGVLRLSVKMGNAAFDDAPGHEVSRILNEAAAHLRDGEQVFTMRDVNGHLVGKCELRDPVYDVEGKVDMATAMSDDRVLMAEGGYSGIADGEFRYAVTHPETPYGYRHDELNVWLVNAAGELASGYDDPQPVRETLLRELNSDELQAIKDVVEGRVTLEQHEKAFQDEEEGLEP